MAKEIVINKSDYGAESLNRMNRLRHENVHCDFIIKVDGVEIPVHKFVVCANSDYFKAMLSLQETLEGKSGIVEMKESVKICIDFISTGQAKFSYEIARDVLHNAKLFQLKELCEGIVDFLSENLSAETFFHSKKLATMQSCETLSKKCDEFALVHFEEIANETDFVNLDKKYVSHLLKSKKLKVAERVKLQALIKWIKHDSDNRKQHFADMLKHVTLADVPISYRRYLVENEDLLKGSMECMMEFTVSVFDSFDVKTENFEEVQATGGRGVSLSQGIGVYNSESCSWKIFNPSNETWNDEQREIPDADGRCTVLSLNNDIYTLSSNQSVHKLCYTEANVTLEEMQSMEYYHGSFPPAVVFDGLIYVGGCGWGSAMEKAERYDPVSNTWTAISDCKKALRGSSLAATSDAIYKIGGYGKVASSSVEKYNSNTGQWFYVASLNQPRSDSAAVTFNNKIYVLGGGGSQQPQSIEWYDETNNTWTIVDGMQLPYTLTSACVVNGEVYGCGEDPKTKTHKILKLNFENKSVEVICECDGGRTISRIFAVKLVD